MDAMRKLAALAILVAASLAQPAAAQTAEAAMGDWHGAVTTPAGDLTLILTISEGEDGGLSAELESPDQAPGARIPVTSIAVADGQMDFRIAPLNASYTGQWSDADGQWQGTFKQGAEMALNLTRGLPDARPVVDGMDGTWEGTLESNGVKLRLVLRVQTGDSGTIATLDSPDQAAHGIPVRELTRNGPAVSFALPIGGQGFNGTLSANGERINGSWVNPANGDSPISFDRVKDTADRKEARRPQTPQEPFPYTAEEVDFANSVQPEVHLAGTLTLPEGDGPFPAAILITGSGAQDRDETIVGHKPFAVIADHLTRRGIAVLRYDDRGVGGSTGDYSAATSADLATDANAAVRFLAGRNDIRQDAIGFIGHSEGGMIGPIAMADNDDVDFLVMLAGPGTDLQQLMLSQRRLVGARMGQSEEQMDRAEPVMAAIFTAIADADSVDAGNQAALEILTPDAMVALGTTADTDPQLVLMQISNAWFRYFLNYDPAPNIARITVPLLAINGSLDRQVPSQDNLAAIRAAAADNPDLTTMELPGLNHLFQHAPTGAIGEYADIEETFAPMALNIVSDWLVARFVN